MNVGVVFAVWVPLRRRLLFGSYSWFSVTDTASSVRLLGCSFLWSCVANNGKGRRIDVR